MNKNMKTQSKESQSNMTTDDAIALLKEGNTRFVNKLMTDRDLLEQVNVTKDGQFPFATILSCIDSRVSAELIFDQGVGDIFSIRIAGNVLNEDILGSMEFACNVAGSKLIVVLGHSRCGAVKGAVNKVELGNLTGLLKKIEPAIKTVSENSDNEYGNAGFMDEVVEQNVENVATAIPLKSEVLSQMIADKKISIVKGVYHVETGQVIFTN
jgi:carbonic anhydrase